MLVSSSNVDFELTPQRVCATMTANAEGVPRHPARLTAVAATGAARWHILINGKLCERM